MEHDDEIDHQVEETRQYGTEHRDEEVHRVVATALHPGDPLSGHALFMVSDMETHQLGMDRDGQFVLETDEPFDESGFLDEMDD